MMILFSNVVLFTATPSIDIRQIHTKQLLLLLPILSRVSLFESVQKETRLVVVVVVVPYVYYVTYSFFFVLLLWC